MKSPVAVRLDFVAEPRQAPLAGAILLALGLAAAVSVGVMFDGQITERNRLDAELNAATSTRGPRLPLSLHSAEEAAKVEAELSIPWSQLLSELEAAGKDSEATVSLLQVEPDPGKHVVRITAEARSEAAMLEHLSMLQADGRLLDVALVSHQKQLQAPGTPWRYQIQGSW